MESLIRTIEKSTSDTRSEISYMKGVLKGRGEGKMVVEVGKEGGLMAHDEIDDLDFEDEDNIENTFLTFGVSGEEYAIHVAHVTEIVRLQRVFAVPDVARHVRGVINLRGKVIPLLDVRARFGLEETVYTDRTVIVVVETDASPTGLVVDGVYDIAEIAPDLIEPAPALTRGRTTPLVTGMSKRGERISFIVDLGRLVSDGALVDATTNDGAGSAAAAQDQA